MSWRVNRSYVAVAIARSRMSSVVCANSPILPRPPSLPRPHSCGI
ncbi:MAG: hypothetical protein WBA13_19785 [Microcoleaceae cyanobacterium]